MITVTIACNLLPTVVDKLKRRVWHSPTHLELGEGEAVEMLDSLERARVVGVLDAWAERDPGMRRWFMQPEAAGFVGCTLVNNRRDPSGFDRTNLRH